MLYLRSNQKSLLNGNAIDEFNVLSVVARLLEKHEITNGLVISIFEVNASGKEKEKNTDQFANNSGIIKKMMLSTP